MPKIDFGFTTPYLNAAGSLGFLPRRDLPSVWPLLGAFVTNPLSLRPRTPSQGTRFMEYPGGFLLHTGYPNPGLRTAVRRWSAAWNRSPLPVIVHLLVQSPQEAAAAAVQIERLENIIGMELGLAPGVGKAEAQAFVQAAAGEKMLIVRLPFEQVLELAPVAVSAGAAAVSLGAPRGALPDLAGGLVEGRLYGPGIYPQALQRVRELARLEIPFVAAGGVYNLAQAQVMLEAGASAVQLDSFFWA